MLEYEVMRDRSSEGVRSKEGVRKIGSRDQIVMLEEDEVKE